MGKAAPSEIIQSAEHYKEHECESACDILAGVRPVQAKVFRGKRHRGYEVSIVDKVIHQLSAFRAGIRTSASCANSTHCLACDIACPVQENTRVENVSPRTRAQSYELHFSNSSTPRPNHSYKARSTNNQIIRVKSITHDPPAGSPSRVPLVRLCMEKWVFRLLHTTVHP